MIITIIFVSLLLIGIVCDIIAYKTYSDSTEIVGIIFTISGGVFTLAVLITIMISHICAPKAIQTNRIQYDGLCKRYEIIKSDYEDVSKSQVIADITAWNTMVYDSKYWANSKWTNWFNPKDVADNMDYIPLE